VSVVERRCRQKLPRVSSKRHIRRWCSDWRRQRVPGCRCSLSERSVCQCDRTCWRNK